MKTAKDLELSILLKESQIQQLKLKVNKLENKITIIKDDIEHELYNHILVNDEESWLPELYTNNKLDYRKMLIHFMKYYLEILEGEDNEED